MTLTLAVWLLAYPAPDSVKERTDTVKDCTFDFFETDTARVTYEIQNQQVRVALNRVKIINAHGVEISIKALKEFVFSGQAHHYYYRLHWRNQQAFKSVVHKRE